MTLRCLAAGLGAAITVATAAQAAHPSVEACGGFAANRNEGVQQLRFLSRKQERTIETFLTDADAVPGLSIAIVKDDRIVYARGFGYRDLAKCEDATSQTRYYLKSTTKNFLGAAAAILHEEGAIELDAPISEYLPGICFPDGLNAKQASIRAHLTHTNPTFDAGLNYRTAYSGNLVEEDYVSHLNKFSQVKDIRFRYSNVGPIMAAHAIGAKTGTNWRDFIREKIFRPAGMTNSFTVMAKAEDGPMAQGYIGAQNADFEPTHTKTDRQMHAAGGAVSTVADMGRWLILNLNSGRLDDIQMLPQRAIEQTHARQVQLKAEFTEYKRFAYGLGLYSADYEGDLLMHHFGGETHMSFMPDHNIGVVVLTNELAFGGRVTHALASSIYDMLLQKPDLDERMERRLEAIAAAKTNWVERLEQYMGQLRERAPSGDPTLTLADLVGDYIDPRLGQMTVAEEGDGVKVVFGEMSGPLSHLGGDAYLADFGMWGDPPEMFVFRTGDKDGFILDWGGRIFVRQ